MLGGGIINKISDVIDRDVRKPITTQVLLTALMKDYLTLL